MQFTIYTIGFETNNYLLWPHLVLNDILLRCSKICKNDQETAKKTI
jgi:hypothetical protein